MDSPSFRIKLSGLFFWQWNKINEVLNKGKGASFGANIWARIGNHLWAGTHFNLGGMKVSEDEHLGNIQSTQFGVGLQYTIK